MKYTNKEKTTVVVDNTTIPRNHRLWYELEIDKAEEAGDIEEYMEPAQSVEGMISLVETKQTPRLIREAALGDVDSIQKLRDLDNEIRELRESGGMDAGEIKKSFIGKLMG